VSVALPQIVQRLGSLSVEEIKTMLAGLSDIEATAVLSDWHLWALDYQRLPPGKWRRWIFRAGRGTGKTFTGSRTTNFVAADRSKVARGEIGILGRTAADARFTMVEGPSGILETAPPDFRPTWEPGNGTLLWPNGVRGRVFSASQPESMRGPNWSWVWADEPAHWPNLAKSWWEVIEPAIRSGWARAMLTTTPLPASDLIDLESRPGSIVTRAATFDNIYLAEEVRDALRSHYEGTRIGRQELLGEYLETNERALWQHATIDDARIAPGASPSLRRIVVAVDPAVTAHATSDETGIVVAGIDSAREGYVLADYSLRGSPAQWGRAAVEAYHRHRADAIVVEVNNGGDLVSANIRAIDEGIKVISVHASRGKVTRAEPVAALYEQGKVHHVGIHEDLEEQMTEWDPLDRASPDRIDALVWAFHELLLSGARRVGPIDAYL